MRCNYISIEMEENKETIAKPKKKHLEMWSYWIFESLIHMVRMQNGPGSLE